MDELVRRKERDEITQPIGYFAICMEAHICIVELIGAVIVSCAAHDGSGHRF